MDNQKLLLHALSYIRMMAEGKNPLTGAEEPEGSALKEERVKKCLSYVAGVLEDAASGKFSPARVKKGPFSLTEEQRARVRVMEGEASLRELLDHIYTYAENGNMKIIPRGLTRDWLAEEGLLLFHDGHFSISPEGKAAGLIWRQPDGVHWSIFFTPEAQQWLIDRLPELLSYIEQQKGAPKIDPETGEVLGKRSSGGKIPFSLDPETLDSIAVLPGGVSISRFVQNLNSYIIEGMQKLSRTTLTDWLTEHGYLERVQKDSRQALVPIEKGETLGIRWECRGEEGRSYWGTVYYDEAQTFLLTHLDEILR